MEYRYINNINSPDDLKLLPVDELPKVAEELRDFIINELSHNPGHLASSLGTIELTIALHYVFDTPHDKLVWDVGHQAYAHKILTGRRDRFHTNRQKGGLAPFPTPDESEYDSFVSGHASNSISAALGIEVASQLQHKKRHVVAIIGDGSMTGGLAFEGLNNTSMDKNDLLIILNDNNMAIDPLKGGFTQYLVDLTTTTHYNRWRWRTYQWLKRHRLLNEEKKGAIRGFGNSLKALLTNQPSNIFQGLDIRYFGPTDGHNIAELIRILTEIKNHKGPKVLHILTKKGKGYKPAEKDQTTWHAPGQFNPQNGERLLPCSPADKQGLWQEVFGEELLRMAQENEKIVGITPAMPTGCSMNIMQKALPDRVFDVGIAEGHAVTFAGGLAKEGMLPFCNEYSSFLQRAYDNIVHDVSLLRLHVVLCIDRAGIVGNDGATHHGLLDMAMLRPIPGMQICAPRTAEDLRQMMRLAASADGPFAIRYPRGMTPEEDSTQAKVEYGKAYKIKDGKDIALLTIGAIGNAATEAIRIAEAENPQMTVAHYDMRWLKPIDTAVLDEVAERFDTIITAEDGIINGGLGSAVAEYMTEKGANKRIVRIGVKDTFVEHGSPSELYAMLGMDAKGIAQTILKTYSEKDNK